MEEKQELIENSALDKTREHWDNGDQVRNEMTIKSKANQRNKRNLAKKVSAQKLCAGSVLIGAAPGGGMALRLKLRVG